MVVRAALVTELARAPTKEDRMPLGCFAARSGSLCQPVAHRKKRFTTHQQNTRTCSAIPKIEGPPSFRPPGPSIAAQCGQRGHINPLRRPLLNICFYSEILSARRGCVTTCRTNREENKHIVAHSPHSLQFADQRLNAVATLRMEADIPTNDRRCCRSKRCRAMISRHRRRHRGSSS